MNILLLLAFLPVLLIGLFVYNADKIEKEPTKLLIELFLLGCLAALFSIGFDYSLEKAGISRDLIEPDMLHYLLYSFIAVGLVQEILKWLSTYIITWRNRSFNYLYDPMVYAVFVSLGFALLESAFYAIDNNFSEMLLRAVITIPAHAFFGVFMGYYIGLAKREQVSGNKVNMNKFKLLSLLIPASLHGFYGFCLLINNSVAEVVFIFYVVILYVISYRRIKQISVLKDKIIYFSDYEDENVYCKNCGNIVTTKYCTKCGTKNPNM